MDLLGITLGPNVPTAVVGMHVLIAAFFLFDAGTRLSGGGEMVGVAISAAIGLMVVERGVSVGRIAARR